MDATAELSKSSALDILSDHLRQQHGDAVMAILYYGSCLRSNDPFTGIIDLYLITESYSATYTSKFRAFINWLLPPNVFYKELQISGRVLRVKYNVLSVRDFRRGLTGRWMHSYLWGRFSQPIEILWSQDATTRQVVETYLAAAVQTFLDRVLPNVPASGEIAQLWEKGLSLSYSAELRSEKPQRAKELVAHDLIFYKTATAKAAPSLRYPLKITGEGQAVRYEASVSASRRLLGRLAWVLRRIHGKVLSVARLIKSLLTFDGGLDYAAWKLERHSGQHVEIPDRVRRFPLIFVWPLLWKLYRQGIIR